MHPSLRTRTRQSPIRFTLIVAAGVTLFGLASCASEKAAPDPSSVSVELKEWAFEPSAATAPAGKVTFKAVNKGKEVHELVLFKTDLAPEAMPLDEEGAVDERGAGLELIDEVENVKVGQSKVFVADLKPGKYVMACNLVANGQRHFKNAMYREFTIVG
jgi:uncharacterized cupredoxin-like copper-binding protein